MFSPQVDDKKDYTGYLKKKKLSKYNKTFKELV